MDLDSLARQYAIPGHISFYTGPGGLVTAAINNQYAEATVTLAGAQVMAYARHGEPQLLWVSPVADHTIGKEMRGGVPICWPWFGRHPSDPEHMPMHGFVRTMVWALTGTRACPDGSTELRMTVHDTAETRALWPHPFELEAVVTVGTKLRVEWIARSREGESYTYTGAFHPYFAVSDIRLVTVRGLEGTDYLDYTDRIQRKTQAGPIHFVDEVDGVYLDTAAAIAIEDPGLQRTIWINKENSRTTVVWNPGHLDTSMEDVGPGQHRRFVCVETANAANDVVTVPAGGEARLAMVAWPEKGAGS